MKLSEAKSIGKKIICAVLCVVLLLIFTSSSYGAYDPDWYRLREHPDQELLSPPNGDQFDDVLLLITPNWNGFSLLIYIKNDSPKENPNSQRVTTQEVKFKTNNVEKTK